MKENKRKLLQKHLGGVPLYHMRQVNLKVMERYLEEKTSGRDTPGLCYRFGNRMKLAQQQYPKNPIKKLAYYLRLRRVSCNLFHKNGSG